jgi:hypothetical protein
VIDDRGYSVQLDSEPTGSTVVVKGKYDDKDVIVGNTYTLRYRFSKFFRRRKDTSGSSAISDGRIQIRKLKIDYASSSYFKVEVTPQYRSKSTYKFTGRTLGTPTARLGIIPISDGTFDVPINCQNTQALVDIVNDSYLPSFFLSALWEGFYNVRSRLI